MEEKNEEGQKDPPRIVDNVAMEKSLQREEL